MDDLKYVRNYINDLLVITNGDQNDHLNSLEAVLKRLQEAGLKVNAKQSFFGRTALEYLGYWITQDGVQPLQKKVPAILNMQIPTNKREVRHLIGMINYYRVMWIRISEILAPLT